MYKPKEAKLFGVALKRLLDEKGLSDRKFAKQAELEHSYVSKLLNTKQGKEIAEPRKKTRQKLAKGLGITEQELLEQIAQYSDSEAEKTISVPPGLAETEEAIAKPYQESVESDAGSIEDRIFKATDQLNPERPVFSRISGIQALGEIAKDSPRYHWQIMEVLAAFVRTNAPRKEEGEEERSPKLREDIQAALTVIGQRDPKKDKGVFDLRNIDIRGSNLRRANLQGVDFRGTNLQGSSLQGANLRRAFLSQANLQKANLSQANLQGAYLISANLQSADLRRTKLQEAILWKANLQEAILGEANLQRAFVGEADFSGAKNLKLSQIELAEGDSTTYLPKNLEPPTHWAQVRSDKGGVLKRLIAKKRDHLKLQAHQKRSSLT